MSEHNHMHKPRMMAVLLLATTKGYDPVVQDPQGKLQKFTIAGGDKKWFWADAPGPRRHAERGLM